MVFIDITDEHGKKTGIAHLNFGRKKVDLCAFCWKLDGLRQLATKLCDFPVDKGKNCDKPMCHKHATNGGKNIDYCPEHKDAAPQRDLPL